MASMAWRYLSIEMGDFPSYFHSYVKSPEGYEMQSIFVSKWLENHWETIWDMPGDYSWRRNGNVPQYIALRCNSGMMVAITAPVGAVYSSRWVLHWGSNGKMMVAIGITYPNKALGKVGEWLILASCNVSCSSPGWYCWGPIHTFANQLAPEWTDPIWSRNKAGFGVSFCGDYDIQLCPCKPFLSCECLPGFDD